MGGFDAEFNPPLEDKYKCPVCLTALREPVQTKCGHRLCFSCFKQIRGGNWYFRCPVDNTWTNYIFEDNACKREILSLKVDCVNHVNKCEWNGELRELNNHVKSCQHESTECPNLCKTPNIMRLDLDKHLLECPLRIEKCQHCKVDVVVTQLARHHLLMCPKFPINCPVCGDAQISRENINSHVNIINGDCPMTIIPCSFRHIGCLFQDQRCRMPKHYQEANTQHLMFLSTRLVDLETRHRLDLENCQHKFEGFISELKAKVEVNEKRNLHLESELSEYKSKYGLLNAKGSKAQQVESQKHASTQRF